MCVNPIHQNINSSHIIYNSNMYINGAVILLSEYTFFLKVNFFECLEI